MTKAEGRRTKEDESLPFVLRALSSVVRLFVTFETRRQASPACPCPARSRTITLPERGPGCADVRRRLAHAAAYVCMQRTRAMHQRLAVLHRRLAAIVGRLSVLHRRLSVLHRRLAIDVVRLSVLPVRQLSMGR